jgi:4-amino-4-deoxy-L-arabinose transferase-like glycosyltransferase
MMRNWRAVPGDVVLGAVSGLVTFAVYAIGAGRLLWYDSAAAVGHFVDTPSWLDPFRRQVDFNNQPLFTSAVRTLVHLSGRRDEVTLRLLPMLAGAATVAVLVTVATRRLGAVAGVCAGAVLATNNMFVVESREVRPYSIAALCTLVSTLLLARLLARDGPPSWRLEAAYVGSLAVGIGMHLYVVLVVVGHATAVLALRRLSRRWLGRWTVALGAGLLTYAGVADTMISHPGRGRRYDPRLLRTLLRSLGGTASDHPQPPWALAVVLVVLIAGLALARPRRVYLAVAGGQVVAFVLIWQVVRPGDTYPRFWTFATPACGWLVAVVVARARWVAVPVLAAATALAAVQAPRYDEEEWTWKVAAAYVDYAADRGLTACAPGPHDGSRLQPLLAYTKRYRIVTSPADLATCDVVVLTTGATRDIWLALRDRTVWRYAYQTTNRYPAHVLSRVPLHPTVSRAT